jgi:hypothetical protein
VPGECRKTTTRQIGSVVAIFSGIAPFAMTSSCRPPRCSTTSVNGGNGSAMFAVFQVEHHSNEMSSRPAVRLAEYSCPAGWGRAMRPLAAECTRQNYEAAATSPFVTIRKWHSRTTSDQLALCHHDTPDFKLNSEPAKRTGSVMK